MQKELVRVDKRVGGRGSSERAQFELDRVINAGKLNSVARR